MTASLADLLLLILFSPTLVSATLQIVPGATWTATNTAHHMQAHGGGITTANGTHYLIGEDKTLGTAFQNINCYSSRDLVQWTYVGALLSQTAAGGDLGPNRVVERPKVVHNPTTGRYVMYMHIDDASYGEAKVGVALGGQDVCSPYEYRGSWRPLGFQSRDMGVFVDGDGTGYLLSEDRANGLRIYALTSDFLNVTREVHLFDEDLEAPAMLKMGAYYFMFASHLSGWSPNDNVYSYATSIAGPWSSWKTFAAAGSNTYSSQTTFVLPLGTSNAIYMGDRWLSSNLMASTYVWLPLNISGTTITMNNYVNWAPNLAAGTWAPGPSESWPEAESASISNGAVVIDCSGCSGSKAVGDIGGPSHGTVSFSGITSSANTRSTIRVKYENGDSTQRFANISVNGAVQTLAFLPTTDGQTPGSSVLHANLVAGSGNSITVSTSDGTYGPDVDRVMVPLS